MPNAREFLRPASARPATDRARFLPPAPVYRDARRALPRSRALPALLVLLAAGCGGAADKGGDAEAGAAAGDGTSVAVENLDPELPELGGVEGFGYQPRACGFDLDDDGVWGEAEDDCRICDGTTADPDGDGVEEDLIYVDCGAGVDGPACGPPEAPCASLSYAWQHRTDGPSDGAEDILCFRGSCREPETLRPPHAGVEGTVVVAASGSQGRDFERPRDPAMLVGWDHDGDGEYPPMDPDDQAVLDGWQAAPGEEPPADRALALDARNDRLELAHFTVRGHGTFSSAKSSGFLAFGPSQGELEHVFLHDLHLVDINRRRETASEVSTLNLFAGKTRLRWLWLHNIWAPRQGGWLVRGSGLDQGPDAGPFRFQGLSVTAEGCDFADCRERAAFTAFHLWGYLSGVEILDSHFRAGVDTWQPKPKGGPTGARFALVAQCSRDWLIRGNRIVDFKNALRVQGWAERYCDGSKARTVDDVVFDRNEVRNSYAPWASGDMAVLVSEGGDDAAEAVEDLTLSNNLFYSPVGWEACVWIHGGNGEATPPGRIRIVNNTCVARVDYHGALVVGDTGGQIEPFPHQRIEVHNNLISGLAPGDPVLRLSYAPTDWRADHNRYDPTGSYRWLGSELPDLQAWREASGRDGASEACTPVFADLENGDARLASDDTCARGAGIAVEGVPATSLDGVDRPFSQGGASGWSIGALEGAPEGGG
ncbi:MAG: hypothetical protein MI919_17740 [Holophagales bacterium]|nr:hypothetical protein [Holophagales bacterium]